ncbi:protein NETWORKED 4A-like [Amaranthus tricolor]|uniref:protein NETWORKED 4A-like n=1 Tax=Amaranthus tricolor TaxID=29722 RepID=UPI00258AE653|nr:protein NETWORKED 4A-like [Amaranthus tricolor]
MTSSSVNSKSSFRGSESRKSGSWWWDSHIGRNARWLAENLEEMDRHYKHMLKLIQGDGDSLAKKADMYYQKRPELISHVEEFYRMYKSLAERYEHLTGEVRKNIPPDLQSQGSVGSDASADVISFWSPQESKISHRKTGPRAAGFEFFLGPKKSNVDHSAKGDETPSISDSETEYSESDVSSMYSYPGTSVNTGEDELHAKSLESETESCDVEKSPLQLQENRNALRKISSGNVDYVHPKIVDYEEELRMANEKIRLLEEEIANSKTELQKFTLSESSSNSVLEDPDVESMLELDVSRSQHKIRAMCEELRITNRRLEVLDKEVTQLRKENRDSSENIRKMQDLLRIAQKDAAIWKAKIESEKRQSGKLQERIARYKTSLADRENEVRDLKDVISDVNRKYQLHAEISRLTDEKTRLEEKLRESEVNYHLLETQLGALERKLNEENERLKAEIAEKTHRLEMSETDLDEYKLKHENLLNESDKLNVELSLRNDQIAEMEKHLQHLVVEKEGTGKVVAKLTEKVEKQKVFMLEVAEGKREVIRQLCFSLEHYRNEYQHLRQAFIDSKQLHVYASK